jgi:hypothetical protein
VQGFAALRDAITTKDQIGSAPVRPNTCRQPGDIYKAQTFIADAASSLKGGVLWSKDTLKASKGCCQSR